MIRLERILLLAATGLVVSKLGTALKWFPINLRNDRLPANLKPTAYDIQMDLYKSGHYRGEVNISVQFVYGKTSGLVSWLVSQLDQPRNAPEAPLTGFDTIMLHMDSRVQVDTASLVLDRCASSDGPENVLIVSYGHDEAKQMLRLRLAKEVEAGSTGRLSFKFGGTMEEEDKERLIARQEAGDSTSIVGLFTPTKARTVLPCFDEPQFVTPIRLSLEQRETDYQSTA